MALLNEAAASDLPYAPLCEGALYVRNAVSGHATSLERATDFLRDHVWGGERVITFAKDKIYRDAFLEKAATEAVAGAAPERVSPSTPLVPALAPESAGRSIVADHLGLDLATSTAELDAGTVVCGSGSASGQRQCDCAGVHRRRVSGSAGKRR